MGFLALSAFTPERHRVERAGLTSTGEMVAMTYTVGGVIGFIPGTAFRSGT
jgi:hypothetical protein